MNEVEDFLSHFGVKGMRWGVSRAKTQEQIDQRNRRLKKGAAIGGAVAIAAGASFVAGRISGGKGKVKVSDMNKGTAKLIRDIGANYTHGILKSEDIHSTIAIKNTARQVEEGLIDIVGRTRGR